MSTEECRNRPVEETFALPPSLLKTKALIILHTLIKDKTGQDEQHPKKHHAAIPPEISLPDALRWARRECVFLKGDLMSQLSTKRTII